MSLKGSGGGVDPVGSSSTCQIHLGDTIAHVLIRIAFLMAELSRSYEGWRCDSVLYPYHPLLDRSPVCGYLMGAFPQFPLLSPVIHAASLRQALLIFHRRALALQSHHRALCHSKPTSRHPLLQLAPPPVPTLGI